MFGFTTFLLIGSDVYLSQKTIPYVDQKWVLRSPTKTQVNVLVPQQNIAT